LHPSTLNTQQENRSHIFSAQLSGAHLSEDDVIEVPNIPLVSAIPNVKAMGFLAELAFRGLLLTTRPKEFQRLTVRDYLMGYRDDFMNLISTVKPDFRPENVGILAPRRGITPKNVTVYTGEANIDNLGKIHEVNGRKTESVWSTSRCNEISGSDGVIFPARDVRSRADLHVYLPDFCRSLPLTFDREVSCVSKMESL